MAPIYRLSWHEFVRLVQAANRYVDPTRLFLTFPTKGCAALITEFSDYARRRRVLRWLTSDDSVVFLRQKYPSYGLGACCPTTIGTVAYQDFIRLISDLIADRSAKTSTFSFETHFGARLTLAT